MNPDPNPESATNQQLIEQVLFYARTFRKHSLILYGKKEISPYDLASNGFVNKHFKEEQKHESLDESNLKNVICVCRVLECSKTLKFNSFENEKYENQDDEEEIEQMLTDHEESCSFYKKTFYRLGVSELFSAGHLFFNKIYESFKKDQSSSVQRLKIDWSLVEACILAEQQSKGSVSILFECYKWLDHRFSVSTKRFDPAILLSLFGWKLQSLKQNSSMVFKCHFCSKKVEKQTGQGFDFNNQHNLWCLIRKKQYQLWKLILKKKYTIQKDQVKTDKKTQQFILPKSKTEIESKQIREQVYQFVKPTLQKIDELLQESLDIVRKQRHLDEEFQKRAQIKENEVSQKYLPRYTKLDQISKKCQQTITNFINSIQSKRS